VVEIARMAYENFDVRIEKIGESYRTRISADSSGEGQADTDLSTVLAELDGFLFNIGHVRSRMRGRTGARLAEAKKFGTCLFETAFRGDALSCLQTSLANASARGAGMRIRLHHADVPELSDIPWEFLFNKTRQQFLSLSAYTPIIRYLDCPESIRPLDVAPPLRILVVISSPSDYPRLDVEREWSTLNEALADLKQRQLVMLKRLDKPQLAALPRALREGFHVLHFIGHGEFNDDGGVLVFEDEWQRGKQASAVQLGTVLHDQLSLRLVVLNSCEGARATRIDPFSGTAQTLVRQGIPAVLAMQFEITDEAAITVASEFYESAAIGDPIDTALADARLKLFALQEDGIEWATPVLYMRCSDGRIFDVAQTDTVINKQKARGTETPIVAGVSRRQFVRFASATLTVSAAAAVATYFVSQRIGGTAVKPVGPIEQNPTADLPTSAASMVAKLPTSAVTYLLTLRLSDGGSASGYFKFDNDNPRLVDYNILVTGGDEGRFPEKRYTPSNSKSTIIRRNDGPGFPVYTFDLTHADGVVSGLLPALRWTTPVNLPTLGSSVQLTTWGNTQFGLANQQCYDCEPQRQGVSGFVEAVATGISYGTR